MFYVACLDSVVASTSNILCKLSLSNKNSFFSQEVRVCVLTLTLSKQTYYLNNKSKMFSNIIKGNYNRKPSTNQ